MSSLLPSEGFEIKTSESSVLQRTHVLDIEATITTPEAAHGTCLTWKDIWVNTIAKGKSGSRSILQGLTGYAKPGQLLAIMGPSGCGKSTLLDTLAGRLATNTRQTGEILINGHKQQLSYGTSAYVTQDDILLTTLTVREAVYYSAQLQLPNTMSKSEKKQRADSTIREMGLQDAINTRIGGWGVKGISGGQKRRVSICIEILTHPSLLFLDEPTSGLDSAASYYVMKRISSLGKKDGIQRTIVASIHQPSTEVFQLFDYLCLLSSGKTVYFGPASNASEFFALNGFPCPPLQNPSDHLLKTINKDFDQDTEIELAGTDKMSTEEAIDILVSSYKSSEMNKDVHNEVTVLSKKQMRSTDKKKEHARFFNQCLVLIERSSLNMFRDLGYYWLRLGIYIALAISLGTVFFDFGTTYASMKDRSSLLSYISGFLTFMSIGGFPSFVEDMKVFQRERQNGHYGVIAYVIGNTFSSTPFIFVVSIIPAVIVYYLCGLQKGYEHFFFFAGVLFSSLMLVESLMMIVSSIVPNYLMGIITGAGIQGVMMLVGGFFKLPHDLPNVFWKYPFHYIAFHTYVTEGLFKNEFEGLRFDHVPNAKSVNSSITGEVVLTDTWQISKSYSKWVDLAILFGMIVLYRVLFLLIIKGLEKMKPIVGSILSSMGGSSKTAIHVVEKPDATPLNGHVVV